MRALALFIPCFLFLSCAHKETKLCDNVTLKEGRLELSSNEQVIVCGSPKGGEGWRDVPIPQAQYQLNVLLQESGYLTPRFERTGDRLDVWSGPRTVFKDLKVHGADGLLEGSKKRKVIGETITPAKLDEINQWADTDLRSKGYACPQVDVKAQVWDGLVNVSVNPGIRQTVAGIRRTGLDNLDEDTLARYLAFEAGDWYDVRETQLSVNRLLSDGLIQSAYFTSSCRGDQVDLHLRADVGRPRLFRFGVGASTEEFPFLDIWFKNTKLDGRASSLTATLYASPRVQRFNLGTELYILPFTKRGYFGPRFQTARKTERFLEELSGKAGADVGRNWDKWSVRWRGRAGPTLNYVNTVKGKGPRDVLFLSYDASLLAMNHVYESGLSTQFEGWQASLDYSGQRAELGSYLNVDKYQFNYKQLFNLGGFSPPLVVLGTRFELTSVNSKTDLRDPNAKKLPSDYRVFFGGDDNLRGFGRKILNNNDFGYLTAGYAGFEMRLIEQLPYHLEPFVLYDIAKLGDGRANLDDPIFTSWGLGLRWPSPFGTLRGSAARGRIYNENQDTAMYPQEWVFFLSFGQEF